MIYSFLFFMGNDLNGSREKFNKKTVGRAVTQEARCIQRIPERARRCC